MQSNPFLAASSGAAAANSGSGGAGDAMRQVGDVLNNLGSFLSSGLDSLSLSLSGAANNPAGAGGGPSPPPPPILQQQQQQPAPLSPHTHPLGSPSFVAAALASPSSTRASPDAGGGKAGTATAVTAVPAVAAPGEGLEDPAAAVPLLTGEQRLASLPNFLLQVRRRVVV
jgi:hypothetical protein